MFSFPLLLPRRYFLKNIDVFFCKKAPQAIFLISQVFISSETPLKTITKTEDSEKVMTLKFWNRHFDDEIKSESDEMWFFAKVTGFTLQFFSSPAPPGPKQSMLLIFCAISVPSDFLCHQCAIVTSYGRLWAQDESFGLCFSSWESRLFAAKFFQQIFEWNSYL